jgi:cobalt transporter subunit CbtB
MTHVLSSLKHLVLSDTAVRQIAPALAAGLLGIALLYGVAFAQPELLHDAAHDVRHSFAFPCH